VAWETWKSTHGAQFTGESDKEDDESFLASFEAGAVSSLYSGPLIKHNMFVAQSKVDDDDDDGDDDDDSTSNDDDNRGDDDDSTSNDDDNRGDDDDDSTGNDDDNCDDDDDDDITGNDDDDCDDDDGDGDDDCGGLVECNHHCAHFELFIAKMVKPHLHIDAESLAPTIHNCIICF
jgi:hypothetical protein